MKLLDYIILIALALAIFWAVRYIFKSKKQGCSGCSRCNDCNACNIKDDCKDYHEK